MERKKYLIYTISAISFISVGLGIAKLITGSNTQISDINNTHNKAAGDNISEQQANNIDTATSLPTVEASAVTDVNGPTQIVMPTPTADPTYIYKYNNGSYSVTVDYSTPDGVEKIGVSFTVQNDVVVNSQFTDLSKDKKSKQYNRLFGQNYQSQVNGKPLDSIQLSNVSGASLTTQAFNKAVDQIRMQARN
ncbi:MAG: FMN-binding protein [Candidatus Dojkabacteria bacterium]|nr:MAG: FMN-binding protein [Candidatus Dojkabacteria bacterium]